MLIWWFWIGWCDGRSEILTEEEYAPSGFSLFQEARLVWISRALWCYVFKHHLTATSISNWSNLSLSPCTVQLLLKQGIFATDDSFPVADNLGVSSLNGIARQNNHICLRCHERTFHSRIQSKYCTTDKTAVTITWWRHRWNEAKHSKVLRVTRTLPLCIWVPVPISKEDKNLQTWFPCQHHTYSGLF